MLPKASPESPPMFESALIDRFSRTHFLAVPMLFVPAALALLAASYRYAGLSWTAEIGLFLGGFLAWTFTEYWLHRTLFHWVPSARWGERFHFLLHGVHHIWPNDRFRLVMPPAVSMGLFFLFLGLFYALLGESAWAFHAGFTTGYMNYDLTHYAVHHFPRKRGRFARLRQHHMTHHFKKDHWGKFGVSTRLWDRVFGTIEGTRSGGGIFGGNSGGSAQRIASLVSGSE